MTGGAGDIVERYAPESVRHDIAERLMSIEPDQRGRAACPHRTPGRQ